jgi:peptide subunit release factor 1 (eRF1)
LSCLDERIKSRIIAIVDTAYGGKQGLHQSISLASSELKVACLSEENKIISSIMCSIANGDGLVAIGLEELTNAFDSGSIDTVIISESKVWQFICIEAFEDDGTISLTRFVKTTDEKNSCEYGGVIGVCEYEQKLRLTYKTVTTQPIMEWLVSTGKNDYNIKVCLITSGSPEATQFEMGIGGIAAKLRYAVNMDLLEGYKNFNFEHDNSFDEKDDFGL